MDYRPIYRVYKRVTKITNEEDNVGTIDVNNTIDSMKRIPRMSIRRFIV